MKGADSSIIQKLLKIETFDMQIIKNLENFAEDGLRTLMFAMKEFSSEIDVSLINVEDLESNLILLGASGLEDELQD